MSKTSILECDKFLFLFFFSNSVQLIRFSYKFITDKISELISSIPYQCKQGLAVIYVRYFKFINGICGHIISLYVNWVCFSFDGRFVIRFFLYSFSAPPRLVGTLYVNSDDLNNMCIACSQTCIKRSHLGQKKVTL